MSTKKPSPAQLAARQKFADMVRARASAAKGKKMPRKNPMESALIHLSGTKYGQVKQQGHIYTAYVLQKVNTGIGEEMDLLDSKSFKTKSGAANWIAKNYGRKTNPHKKTVSQKISQLEHEGYPHKQSIAIALSEQRRGKVKRNPMMSSSQLAKIKKELQETERLLAKEIMNYSVQNQDEQLIDFYHKHIAKLKKALQNGKLEDVMNSVRKYNPINAYTVFYIGTRNIAGQVMASGAETAKKMVAEKIGMPSIAYLKAKKETNRQGFYANNPKVAKPQKVYKVSIMQEGLHKNWMPIANFFTFAEAENYSHHLAKQHKNWSIRVHDTRAMK